MQNMATDIGQHKQDRAVDGEGAATAGSGARPLPQTADLHKWSRAVSGWDGGKGSKDSDKDAGKNGGHCERKEQAADAVHKDGGAEEDAPGWPAGRKHKGERRTGRNSERNSDRKEGDADAGSTADASAGGHSQVPVHGSHHGHHGKAPHRQEVEAGPDDTGGGHGGTESVQASSRRAGPEIVIEPVSARPATQAEPVVSGAFGNALSHDGRNGIQPPAGTADDSLNAADQPAPIATGELDTAPVVEQIAACVGAVRDAPGAPYLGFTMEIPHLGSIDGYVLLDGAQAHVTLQPRVSGVAAFLNDQRRDIEARASKRARFGIRLSVLG
jgi:hypothetical protein